ncbi:MAG: DUF434 domain-containing protein [Sphingobacteriia bacterium]|nr:DUF434 domain-containing protein [Sphingobacteriia bacterium]
MLSKYFQQAAGDYLWLLEKGYRAGSILELVGNHYQLPATERSMLYRGIQTEATRKKRAGKLIFETETLAGKELALDGFNVLIAIASYLQGLPVFIASDNWLRDAAHLRNKIQKITRFADAIECLLAHLRVLNPGNVLIFLDKKADLHQQLKDFLLDSAFWKKDGFSIIVSDLVDEDLMAINSGILCTSDSEIIDHTTCRLFDLARNTLENAFRPDFVDMRKFCSPP